MIEALDGFEIVVHLPLLGHCGSLYALLDLR